MTSKLVKGTKVFGTLILGLMLMLSVFSVGTVQANAVGDVDINVSGGKLNISNGGMDYQDGDSAWNAFLTKYQSFIVGVSGIGAISMIAFFIYNFMKLGATSTNPSERAKVLQGLVWSALAAAGLGAVTLIVGFFYGALQDSK